MPGLTPVSQRLTVRVCPVRRRWPCAARGREGPSRRPSTHSCARPIRKAGSQHRKHSTTTPGQLILEELPRDPARRGRRQRRRLRAASRAKRPPVSDSNRLARRRLVATAGTLRACNAPTHLQHEWRSNWKTGRTGAIADLPPGPPEADRAPARPSRSKVRKRAATGFPVLVRAPQPRRRVVPLPVPPGVTAGLGPDHPPAQAGQKSPDSGTRGQPPRPRLAHTPTPKRGLSDQANTCPSDSHLTDLSRCQTR